MSTQTVCRHCSGASRPGLLVCVRCWANVPAGMKASFRRASHGGTEELRKASREILTFLKGGAKS